VIRLVRLMSPRAHFHSGLLIREDISYPESTAALPPAALSGRQEVRGLSWRSNEGCCSVGRLWKGDVLLSARFRSVIRGNGAFW